MAERRFYQGETFAQYAPGELLENAEFEDCVFDHCRWLGTRVRTAASTPVLLTTAIFPAWCSALPP